MVTSEIFMFMIENLNTETLKTICIIGMSKLTGIYVYMIKLQNNVE